MHCAQYIEASQCQLRRESRYRTIFDVGVVTPDKLACVSDFLRLGLSTVTNSRELLPISRRSIANSDGLIVCRLERGPRNPSKKIPTTTG